MRSSDLIAFIATHPSAIVAELTNVRGSSPREAGTVMVIASDALIGTIGGGALEYLVIARARQALRDGVEPEGLDIPLGPEIGQCCGGRVEVALKVLTEVQADALAAQLAAEETKRPRVYLFGSGHVGKALARALAALPLSVHVIDTRPDELHDLPEGVEARAVPMPEAVVRAAPAGSAFVILTHDHALDFLIAMEALKRTDACYVGMVGSKTKRAKFSSWYLAEGGARDALRRLVLPIGAFGLVDKRPEVIAALAAAEIMVHIGRREALIVRAPDSNFALGAVR
ncbi:MAG: xanthine dehydrogenase accessory protein XdhC [Devosia nanyangense]|uniref:Xanthine dehydrogenase accessory protein XdhC n=1 Tax=Devosia nanyangense TaxID=1228055 RepID=A0A933L119_9HYPH|nr:xanthine dehydrogenase accessory protein XdhC [Devosia nanyangense]